MGRLMSLFYGAGAAMTVDEFALWLDLQDVYWSREGRDSVEAALAFFAICAMAYIIARSGSSRKTNERRGKILRRR